MLGSWEANHYEPEGIVRARVITWLGFDPQDIKSGNPTADLASPTTRSRTLFSAGGPETRARYLSPIIAGRVATAPRQPPLGSAANTGVEINGPTRYGSDCLLFDGGMLRHEVRKKLLARDVRASFQLNIRKLLDDHDIEIRRYKSDGITLDHFLLTAPREIPLSTTIRF
jgi:hypothetical protein